MDFNSQRSGLVTPMRPAKLAAPAPEATDEMSITSPTLGPSEPIRPATPNPMTVEPPGIDPGGSLLAETLHWGIPKAAE
jgi:hypothetical protein